MSTIKVRVDYQETWNRTALVEVDEDEFREWAGLGKDDPIEGRKVQEFFEATDYDGMGEAPPWACGDTPDQHRVPSNGIEGVLDEYEGTDIDSVSLIEEVTVYALVNSFASNAPVSYHLARKDQYDPDGMDMLCGARAVIPDPPIQISNQKICTTCSAFKVVRDRLLASGKSQEIADAVLPKVDA